jgi:hypothetical protein
MASMASVASVAFVELLWLLWLLWLGGLRLSPGSQLRSRPGTSSRLSAVLLVTGMAGKGRETWQLGTWRAEVCAVMRDS